MLLSQSPDEVTSLFLHLAATWSLYPALAIATNPVFNDLDPPDGGWSQNPMLTVLCEFQVDIPVLWIKDYPGLS